MLLYVGSRLGSDIQLLLCAATLSMSSLFAVAELLVLSRHSSRFRFSCSDTIHLYEYSTNLLLVIVVALHYRS